MVASINHVVLLGSISPRGIEVRYATSGTPCASFMVVLTETGSDGKPHQLWQPVEIWGKKAEQVGELEPGAVVVIDGKLRRVKKGAEWETVIAAWDCMALTTPAAAPARTSN
jgi:single-stranded DNA-binding protein